MVASAGAALGAAMARSAKTKKKTARNPPSKRKKRNVSSLKLGLSSRVANAPINRGVVSHSMTTPVFSVPFACAILQVSTLGSGSVYPVLQPIGAVPGSGDIAVGVSLTYGSSLAFPTCFPSNITNLGNSFSQYRIRPGTGRLSYRTCVGTTTTGSLSLAVIPSEQPLNSGSQTFQVVSASECALVAPIWAADVSLNPRALNSVLTSGQTNGWKYCDLDGTISQPESRQDTLCTMLVAGLGLSTTATVYGYIFLEGVMEFQHLQNNSAEVGQTPPLERMSGPRVPTPASPHQAEPASSEPRSLTCTSCDCVHVSH